MDTTQLADLLGYADDPAPSELPDAVPDDPVASEFQNSSIAHEYAGNPTPLAQLPQAAPAPVDPTLLKAGGSVSQSASGFSPTAHAAIQQGPINTLDRSIVGDKQAAKAEFAPYQEALDKSALAERESIQQARQASAARSAVEARGNLAIQAEQRKAADEDKAAMEAAHTSSNAQKAQYEQALATIPQVDPTQLWDHSGHAGQFGMATSAFIHDFLGAKGIKTSAMDTINGAISRNMDAQIQNIATKKQAAAGFKDLWQMTQQESASQSEARAKMHGYMLASVKAGIQADMGKYDSRLADATYQGTLAKLDQEIVKQKLVVSKAIEDSAYQRAHLRVTENGQALQASMARQHNATSLEVARMHAEASRQKADKSEMGAPIVDVSKSGGGKVLGRIIPEFSKDKDLARDLANKAAVTAHAVDGVRELLDMEARVKAQPDGVFKTRLADEFTRKMNAVRSEVIAATLLDETGKASVGTERANVENRFPVDTWFTNGGTRSIVAQTLRHKIEGFRGYMRVVTRPDANPDTNQPSPEVPFADSELVLSNIIENGQDGHQDTPVDLHTRNIGAGDAWSADVRDRGATGDQQQEVLWGKYLASHPNQADFLEHDPRRFKGHGALDEIGDAADPKNPPKVFTELYQLAELAGAGDSSAKDTLKAMAANKTDSDLASLAEYFVVDK